ncbi:MAG: calcium/sodium antiporter [Gammaproteobacteria bacterium]
MWVQFAIVGLALTSLVWSASQLVARTSQLARALAISPIIVGIGIIAVGTSLPELVVSVQAAMGNHSGLVVGNVLGSNIANSLLVLGAGLLFAATALPRNALLGWSALVLSLISTWFLYDGQLARWEASILLLLLIPGVWLILRESKYQEAPEVPAAESSPMQSMSRLALLRQVLFVLGFLLVLLISAEFLVSASIKIARGLDIDEQVIGLTILALGTSLPELAAAIAAARQKENELILANLLGSNLFNQAGVMGIAGLILPLSIEPAGIMRDLPVFVLAAIVVALLAWRAPSRPLSIWVGLVLVVSYLGYMVWLQQSVVT